MPENNKIPDIKVLWSLVEDAHLDQVLRQVVTLILKDQQNLSAAVEFDKPVAIDLNE